MKPLTWLILVLKSAHEVINSRSHSFQLVYFLLGRTLLTLFLQLLDDFLLKLKYVFVHHKEYFSKLRLCVD
jgi:hypothetical protein